MNKYQEALEHLKNETVENFENKHVQTDEERKKIVKDVICLGELVEKATPKKPIHKANGIIVCPKCYRTTANTVSPVYCCCLCGQAIDWSTDD